MVANEDNVHVSFQSLEKLSLVTIYTIVPLLLYLKKMSCGEVVVAVAVIPVVVRVGATLVTSLWVQLWLSGRFCPSQ